MKLGEGTDKESDAKPKNLVSVAQNLRNRSVFHRCFTRGSGPFCPRFSLRKSLGDSSSANARLPWSKGRSPFLPIPRRFIKPNREVGINPQPGRRIAAHIESGLAGDRYALIDGRDLMNAAPSIARPSDAFGWGGVRRSRTFARL
jgi:hypothetical protein